jgi:membrane protease YdiL (CAAX protease family)
VNRYSGLQLFAAKCVLVALVALIVGPRLADNPSELAVSILVVLAMLGLAVAAYEGLSHALALVLARLWGRHPATGREPPPAPNRLQARHILAALGAYLAAQAVVWFIVAGIAVGRAGTAASQETLTQALFSSVAVALPVSLIAGGIALLLVLRAWSRWLGPLVLARTLGLSWGTGRQIGAGLASGTALSLIILPLMSVLPDQPAPSDPITQILTSSVSARWAWLLSAVLLAPPVEEVMFRGVLLGGLAKTWNVRAAAIISGGTFWVLHAPEWVRWPVAAAIGLLTLLVTGLRLRTRALGPSMAAHFAYNLVLAAALASVSAEPRPAPRADGPHWAQLPGGALHPPNIAESKLKRGMRRTL